MDIFINYVVFIFVISMLLLTLANRAEASEFIRRKHSLPVDFYFSGLYRDQQELLLLTGTGIEYTRERMLKVCDYYKNKIRAVINFGIAGRLDRTLQLNQIYGIRKVCHESLRKYYTSFDSRCRTSCITVETDVLDPLRSRLLSSQGEVVDRELFAIAAVCSQYSVPFRAYKLLSDDADGSLSREILRSQASTYSKHLFDFYSKLKLYNSIIAKR